MGDRVLKDPGEFRGRSEKGVRAAGPRRKQETASPVRGGGSREMDGDAAGDIRSTPGGSEGNGIDFLNPHTSPFYQTHRGGETNKSHMCIWVR